LSWYWWILLGILGINAFAVILITLFIVWDRLRQRRARAAEDEAKPKRETRGPGRKSK